MRFEIVIIGITIFFIYNTYHNGKPLEKILSWKKYYQMFFMGLTGLSLYLLLKKSPDKSRNLLLYANNAIKYMPVDKDTASLFTPLFDFTNGAKSFMHKLNGIDENGNEDGDDIDPYDPSNQPGFMRMLSSGRTSSKRSVSETKKKYVASMQNWKCGDCQKQLSAWFEVDHKIRLEHGGGNDVGNLIAYCRECHGKKTAFENM